jgi:hypothetical protein
MIYESRHHPPISMRRFLQRMATHTALAIVVVALSVGIGMSGYMRLEHLDWRDAFLNSAMLLGGMGPVDVPKTPDGKLFAAFFALYAGLVVLVVVGVLMAPVVHRFLHRFHWSDESSRAR